MDGITVLAAPRPSPPPLTPHLNLLALLSSSVRMNIYPKGLVESDNGEQVPPPLDCGFYKGVCSHLSAALASNIYCLVGRVGNCWCVFSLQASGTARWLIYS